MRRESKTNRKWLFGLSGVLVLMLTGCGMYPKHPGMWPGGIWGQVLQFVSSVIDYFANLIHVPSIKYGLALLIVTVLVRIIILPFFVKQIRHTKVMQEMQPEIQKIRSKYKGDNQKIQEETMKLWQQTGVNPMAGCFPMVIQLPILYALFGAIEGNVGLSQNTFLGVFHLGQHDHTFILPILAAITTYFSSRVMMAGNDNQQKMMLFIMPVFILLISSRFPSGLALYWVYSNIFTAVQGYFVKVRPANKQAPAGAGAQPVSGKKKPGKKDNQ